MDQPHSVITTPANAGKPKSMFSFHGTLLISRRRPFPTTHGFEIGKTYKQMNE
jgi:hypothetical protein